MAYQGRGQREERYRRDHEGRGDERGPEYGRDFGAPYRGRGYERDQDTGRVGEYQGAERYNGVTGYGANYGNDQSRYGGFRRDTGWTGAGRFDRGDHDRGTRYGGEERNWWDRASDEVSSWFGDRDAEHRRDADEYRADLRGRGPKGYTRSDERIREEVCDRLSDDPFVDASEIEVSVAGGEVTLSGTASNRDERRRAEDCAERVSGVSHVQNNVRVSAMTFKDTPMSGTGHPVTTSSSVGTRRSPASSTSGSDPYSRSTSGSAATGGNPALGGGEGGTGIR